MQTLNRILSTTPVHWIGGLLFGGGAAHMKLGNLETLPVTAAFVGIALTAYAMFRDGWVK